MKVKIFDNGLDLETEINKWLVENTDISIINISISPMHDLYSNSAPAVCNQWMIATILYMDK